MDAQFIGENPKVNDTLTNDMFEVYAFHRDGSKKKVSDFSIKPTQFPEPGTYNVEISFQGKSTECKASVVEITNVRAGFIATSVKTGEALTNEMFEVTAIYSDGKAEVVSDFNISPSSFDEEGDHEVTIAYEGVETQCNVHVIQEIERINIGQMVEIKGLGKFKFTDFDFGTIKNIFWSFSNDAYGYDGGLLIFQFENTDNENKVFYKGTPYGVLVTDNNMVTPIFIYSNPNNIYPYEMASCGFYQNPMTIKTYENYIVPLNPVDLAIGFALPMGLMGSNDGNIDVLLEFSTGDKYILSLRENGQNLFQ